MQKSVKLLITFIFSFTLGGISAPAASIFPGSMVGPDCCDDAEYPPENVSARQQIRSVPAKKLCPDLTHCDSIALLALQCVQTTPPPQHANPLIQNEPAQILFPESSEKDLLFTITKTLSVPTTTSREILQTHFVLII